VAKVVFKLIKIIFLYFAYAFMVYMIEFCKSMYEKYKYFPEIKIFVMKGDKNHKPSFDGFFFYLQRRRGKSELMIQPLIQNFLML